jgi:hypothetical protein
MRYRPRKQEYIGFMNEFTGELKRHFPNVCFGYFGSLKDGRAVYGKADIDGFLIMPGGVVSDKREVRGLSQILARAFSNNPVKTQFNLLDLGTIHDGRFMSYTRDYSDHIEKRARIVAGPEFHFEMNGFDPRFSVLHSASFNFSGPGGVRNTALYSLSLLQGDYDYFSERVESAIDKVAKFPKKLVWLRTGRIIPGRREAQRIVERNLGEVDYKYLDEINDVLDDVSELDRVLGNPEEALRLLYNSLEVMEQMIFAYTTRHPFVGRREVGVTRN